MANISPCVILVRPQLGENIGAVARAMSNFGLSELRLVAPRDGWPSEKARIMAAGALPIIEAARLYDSFAAAMQDVNIAYATTARTREMEKRGVTPQEVALELHGLSPALKAALVFGPERSGLLNEEIVLCDAITTIPTAQNASLNLAQAVVILGYEWWKTQGDAPPPQPALSPPAPKEELHDFFLQLEGYLDAAEYFRTPEKKPLMWQNLQNIFTRAAMNAQEVRTLRGMLRSLVTEWK